MTDYSTTWDGEVEGGIRIIGAGTAKRYARSIASYMISAARSAPETEPVQFVTGSSMYPPLRHFCDADRVWNAGNGYASADEFAGPAIWQVLVNELYRLMREARVYLGRPDSGSGLYVVDLARFKYNKEWRLTA